MKITGYYYRISYTLVGLIVPIAFFMLRQVPETAFSEALPFPLLAVIFCAFALFASFALFFAYLCWISYDVWVEREVIRVSNPFTGSFELDIDRILEVNYVYDFIYVIKYEGDHPDDVRKIFFMRSVLKTLASIFSQWSIEYDGIHDFRERVTVRRHVKGLTATNPLMRSLPQLPSTTPAGDEQSEIDSVS